MADLSRIKEHMEVIGADGVHIGTVDSVSGDRIKLTKADSGSHQGHHHYLSAGLVATIEGDKVRLSANGNNAVLLEEEKTGEGIADDKRLWNWNKVGIGAAAAVGVAAAAAGAAKLLKGRTGGGSDTDDFEMRLETDENLRLISSKKVEGTPVVGQNGETLGTIQSFMVDKYTGRVAYAIMSFGGTAGFGASLFPLPWPLLEYDVEKDGYALDITKEQMASAPRFEASKEPEFSPEYRRELLVFYRP
jgi:hypothetical protein